MDKQRFLNIFLAIFFVSLITSCAPPPKKVAPKLAYRFSPQKVLNYDVVINGDAKLSLVVFSAKTPFSFSLSISLVPTNLPPQYLYTPELTNTFPQLSTNLYALNVSIKDFKYKVQDDNARKYVEDYLNIITNLSGLLVIDENGYIVPEKNLRNKSYSKLVELGNYITRLLLPLLPPTEYTFSTYSEEDSIQLTPNIMKLLGYFYLIDGKYNYKYQEFSSPYLKFSDALKLEFYESEYKDIMVGYIYTEGNNKFDIVNGELVERSQEITISFNVPITRGFLTYVIQVEGVVKVEMKKKPLVEAM